MAPLSRPKTSPTRSALMSRVRSSNTAPEMAVRSVLHRLGFRFRIHVKKLPGTPDIVLPKYRTVIFVHGCFWHQHPLCKKATRPKTNKEFWNEKLTSNVDRFNRQSQELNKLGWKVLTVWECQTYEASALKDLLVKILIHSSLLPKNHNRAVYMAE
ncbi:DNA mismatch endonuclease Vsr [Herbaspirillum sp. HC18]|nr:DNA mismatch endonuclease Vsr [Herbaspirillum sp. HC18]